MRTNELEQFLSSWEREAGNTVNVLRMLPSDGYDFRPDPGGRSIGELAWHLAEIDAFMSHGIDVGRFMCDSRPQNVDRPGAIEALASAYERVHQEAVARIRKLTPEDLDRSIPFFFGPLAIRNLLSDVMLAHQIHHRGQLSLMCRMAGGRVPALYGPTREDEVALREAFPEKPILDRAYAAFNARKIDEALGLMRPDVKWPNGMEGGVLHGREVRAYWTRQWAQIDPRVRLTRYMREPDGRVALEVHQIVRDSEGAVLSERTVQHVYEIRDGLIANMEIR